MSVIARSNRKPSYQLKNYLTNEVQKINTRPDRGSH
jgi:hypothetical protein